MSQINVNTITDEAGTGPVNFPYDFTIAGSALVIPPAHNPVSVSGATQALNLGSYNFFNANDLTVDTTLSFTSVPTNALWTYTAKAGYTEAYTVEAMNYTEKSFSVFSQDNNPSGLAFSSDGLKMYMSGITTNTVYQYTLATAWDVSTATYASLSKNVSAQAVSPYGLAFSSDGLTMYTAFNSSDFVYQYTLSTAWDVSTATYSGLSKSIVAEENNVRGITFSTDGLKMYVVGILSGYVFQYTLSTAWAINTATYSTSKLVANEAPGSVEVLFSPDGLKMFVTDSTTDTVYQYTLSTAWAVNTATYASLHSPAFSSQEISPQGAAFSSDGLYIYILGNNQDTVFQYQSATPTTLTVPAAVQNPPTTAFYNDDQVSYTFVTNDGGTTVRLINEAVT
jgi:sugar lactone lactonase YvrE